MDGHLTSEKRICTKYTTPGKEAYLKGQINRQIPSKLCTYCTHLAGIFKDDMSLWVLSSIHIQRLLVKGD
jgi:hypothetical protein